ncbi:MAG: putative transcriptional regulator [Rhodospirillales bacterium]|jgi:transcriptional regulator with XRE-family HTH domain|nr:putative transcriptional regulator [Rhodospirillales bacterium]
MPQSTLARNRQELSSFIRQHREMLKPADVGLPVTGGRRTKGLRREEVAALAGVGLTWYTWFEQGRQVNVSPAFLENVARALNLDPAGRTHLFVLSGHPAPEPEISSRNEVPPGLQDMIDSLRGWPAYVKDARWQILAWNSAAQRIFGNFAELPEQDRNSLRLAFIDSSFRRAMVNWEEDARRIVARFRADYARHADDTGMRRLVSTLEKTSAEFRRLWRQYEVLDRGQGFRRLQVPKLGCVQFGYLVFRLEGIQKLSVVVYSPDPRDPNSHKFMKTSSR